MVGDHGVRPGLVRTVHSGMKTLLSIGVALFVTTTAQAQPVPPTVDDIEELSRIELRTPPVGATVWRSPGPHELEWYIAYDATPLTIDDPEFAIRLVNNGRPIRTPRSDSQQVDGLTLSLTYPDGTVREVVANGRESGFSVYGSGSDNGLIRPGGPVARLDLRLAEHFGVFGPGVHVLQIDVDTGVQIQRARDGHVTAERLTTTLPPLRFEVIDRPVPEEVMAGEYRVEIFPETERDTLSGRIRGTLSNPLDVPLTIRADTGWDPSWSPTAESPASMYNAIERWTESGWLRDDRVGYCGTGRGDVEVAPGGSLPIALFSPRVHDRSPGVYRCVVTGVTPEGAKVEFVTAPIVVNARR